MRDGSDGSSICFFLFLVHICRINGESEEHDSLSLVPDTRRFCIFSISFSENGNEILGGANDGFLYIFDRDLNQRVLKIEAHDDDVSESEGHQLEIENGLIDSLKEIPLTSSHTHIHNHNQVSLILSSSHLSCPLSDL